MRAAEQLHVRARLDLRPPLTIKPPWARFPAVSCGSPSADPGWGCCRPRAHPTPPGCGASLESLPEPTRRSPATGREERGPARRGNPLGARRTYSHVQSRRRARAVPPQSPSPWGPNPEREIPATPRPRSGRAGPRQSPPPEVRSRGLRGNRRRSRILARVCGRRSVPLFAFS